MTVGLAIRVLIARISRVNIYAVTGVERGLARSYLVFALVPEVDKVAVVQPNTK